MLLLWSVTVISFLISILSAVAVEWWVTDRIPVLGSFAGIVHIKNPGIAFGLRFPIIIQELFILAALILILIAAVRSAKTRLQRIGFGLIIGGALANLLDRARDGYVTDFFQVGNFYIFNTADSCITVGVILLLAETVIMQARSKNYES